MRESRPLRFGIIGCGTASVPVCEAILALPFTTLAAVYDVNQSMANDLAQHFQVQATGTLEELLHTSSVDVIYIAVPHYLLASLTQKALEAGKPVLAEKPLGISIAEVDQLIELSQEKQLTLGVFYEMRFAPAHELVRELIQAGALGNIMGIQMQTLIDKPLDYWQVGYAGRSQNPWRGLKAQAGGGVVLMNTSHLLHALFAITGLHVTQVSAEIGNLLSNVEVEDLASATLRFDNGAIGSLIAGAHISGAHNAEYTSIFGTQGTVRLPHLYSSDPVQLYLKQSWRDYAAEQWHSIPLKPVSVYQCAIEDFAQAIQLKVSPLINAQAARQVLAVVLAIYQSAAERRTISIS